MRELEFARLVIGRVDRHRRWRRRLLVAGCIVAVVSAGLAISLLPASHQGIAVIDAGECVAILFLIAACGIGCVAVELNRPGIRGGSKLREE